MGRVKGKQVTADWLKFDDFTKLCNALHDDGEFLWELYCRLSFYTALRISDVLSLKWKQIVNRRKLQITERKTKKVREIAFSPSTKKVIKELYALLGSPDVEELIFRNPDKDKPYTREHINQMLKVWKVKYRLDIENFSSHTFRKTFGRYVYETHGRSAEALVLLNCIFKHSSIDITKVYIGLRKDEVDNVFNSIKL